jgi:putative ABC transport system permease protein
MLKNYFRVAIRNLVRNKTFTAINIIGLGTGLAVFLLIFEFVAFEWSSNRFHKNFTNLYRLGSTDKNGGHDYYMAPGFLPVVQQRVPGIEAFVRVTDDLGSGVISFQDEKSGELRSFREENISYADGNFLEVFSFPLKAGSTSLREPKTMALSETMAKKFFGRSDVTGRIVRMNNQFGKTDYRVTAVFQDLPEQSDIRPNIILSLTTLQSAANRNENDWADPATTDNGFTNCYVLMKKGTDLAKTRAAIGDVIHSIKPATKDAMAVLQPFSELHLAPGFDYPYHTFGSLKLVVMLLSVALLILLIAWVNYINLSTVQALKRAKETGVRKVLGATRGQLTRQYLAETFVFTLLSVAVSVILVQLLQPLFNSFTGKSLSLEVLNHGWFWTAAGGLILIGSLLSGGYVAFVLSSYKPVVAIRGKAVNKSMGLSLRKGLVVFQFTISIVFIVATMVMYRQLKFMKGSDLGINWISCW